MSGSKEITKPGKDAKDASFRVIPPKPSVRRSSFARIELRSAVHQAAVQLGIVPMLPELLRGASVTIRETFDRRMKPFRLLMGVSAVLIVAGSFAGMGGPPILALVIPGFTIFMLAGMWMQLIALRCPVCSGNCGPIVMQQSWLKVNAGLKYCPYCGLGLDEELEPADEPTEEQF